MKYDISWSGGKDSTASIILAHENNIPIRQINYCRIMYNNYIPAELPEMVEFINKSIVIFQNWGYKVNIIRPDKTAIDLACMRYKRSSYPGRIGKYYGVTNFIRGHCSLSGLKMQALNKSNNISIVGIAYDEPERIKRLGKNISLLNEYKIKEKDTFNICRKYGLLSPLYDIKGCTRGGCFFCPNISKYAMSYLKEKHNELYRLGLNLVKMCDYNITGLISWSNWIKEYFNTEKETETL